MNGPVLVSLAAALCLAQADPLATLSVVEVSAAPELAAALVDELASRLVGTQIAVLTDPPPGYLLKILPGAADAADGPASLSLTDPAGTELWSRAVDPTAPPATFAREAAVLIEGVVRIRTEALRSLLRSLTPPPRSPVRPAPTGEDGTVAEGEGNAPVDGAPEAAGVRAQADTTDASFWHLHLAAGIRAELEDGGAFGAGRLGLEATLWRWIWPRLDLGAELPRQERRGALAIDVFEAQVGVMGLVPLVGAETGFLLALGLGPVLTLVNTEAEIDGEGLPSHTTWHGGGRLEIGVQVPLGAHVALTARLAGEVMGAPPELQFRGETVLSRGPVRVGGDLGVRFTP